MSRRVFFFDFDGTITRIRGSDSPLFYNWNLLVIDDLKGTYEAMKHLFELIFTKEDGQAEKRLYSFFKVLHDTNAIIMIQSNNYEEIVLAYLVYQLHIPLEWIDTERSAFREHVLSKSESIATQVNHFMCEDDDVTFYYAEDSSCDIKEAQEKSPGKLQIINCKRGKRCLNELLKDHPVDTPNDLVGFLDKFSVKFL